jgi:hypothetical protein
MKRLIITLLLLLVLPGLFSVIFDKPVSASEEMVMQTYRGGHDMHHPYPRYPGHYHHHRFWGCIP